MLTNRSSTGSATAAILMVGGCLVAVAAAATPDHETEEKDERVEFASGVCHFHVRIGPEACSLTQISAELPVDGGIEFVDFYSGMFVECGKTAFPCGVAYECKCPTAPDAGTLISPCPSERKDIPVQPEQGWTIKRQWDGGLCEVRVTLLPNDGGCKVGPESETLFRDGSIEMFDGMGGSVVGCGETFAACGMQHVCKCQPIRKSRQKR